MSDFMGFAHPPSPDHTKVACFLRLPAALPQALVQEFLQKVCDQVEQLRPDQVLRLSVSPVGQETVAYAACSLRGTP